MIARDPEDRTERGKDRMRSLLALRTASFVFTPRHPLPLAGYGWRRGPSDGLDGDLEADFLHLSDGGGNAVILGSIDTLFLTEETIAQVRRALGGVEFPMCLFATHTHNAPSLAPELPLLGPTDRAWLQSVTTSCARTIRGLSLAAAAEPVSPRYGEYKTNLNVNRRRPSWFVDWPALARERRINVGRRVALAANRHGTVDDHVRAIFFEDRMGEVKAIVWSFAAHPAFYPASYRISPDFPGMIRDRLRNHFGMGCAVVYLPGFAGSAIPNIPARFPDTGKRVVLAMLPFYPTLRSFDTRSYRRWVDQVFAGILSAHAARDAAPDTTALRVTAERASKIFTCHDGSHRDLDVLQLRLAPDLGILACNGEMLGEWVPLVRNAAGGKMLLSGYLAGAALYVPTSQQIGEGGYEVDGFQSSFGLEGDFAPDITQRVLRAITSVQARGAQALQGCLMSSAVR